MSRAREQVRAEKLEILTYNRARVVARPTAGFSPGLWDDQIQRYDAEIERTERGEFFDPFSAGRVQDQDAHDIALRNARCAS